MAEAHIQARGSYFSREESFMYDKEPKFPMEATHNAARVEYTRNGLTHLESRRCTLVRISVSSAMIEFQTDGQVADQMNLDIPDARIEKLGCMKVRESKSRMSGDKVTVTLRFLRMLTDRELQSVLKHSLLEKREGAGRRPAIPVKQG